MIENTPQSPQAQAAAFSETKENPVVAFCQQCGRGLTASSQRRIGTAIFCEPCGSLRDTQPGWAPVNTGNQPPYAAGVPNTRPDQTPSEANPVLAGFLGLIPGVGAMYNGQYAKGVIHLIIFVVLVSLADNLNWVLWWFVWGWIFYQGFEAYHTAQARRDGQPLPDPFGWNELGERLGFARKWPPSPSARYHAPDAASAYPAAPGFSTNAAATTPRSAEVSENPYASPSAGFTSFPPTPEPVTTPPVSAGTTEIPYASTFTGTPSQTIAQPVFVGTSRRFPIGAVWLIGLGLLFLLGNLLPAWHIEGRWLVPILLAAIALWTGGSRIAASHDVNLMPGAPPVRRNVVGLLFGPCVLLTVAILLALHDAALLLLRHSWPILLIVWGGLLLLQRTADPVLQAPSAGDPVEPANGPVA
ncbi:MAG: hypothetical protein ACRYFU_09440 [Janthinobacterium lividum]